MVKKSVLLLVIFIVFSGILIKGLSFPAQANKKKAAVVTAFGWKDDKGVWYGEPAPFLQKLQNVTDISSNYPMCDHVFEGSIYGKPVMVVIAGVGKIKMTSCFLGVLSSDGDKIEEVLLSGIAGITPMKGGMLDKLGRQRNDEKVMIGDVCINSAAYDFEAQYYSADIQGQSNKVAQFWSSDSHDPSKQVNLDTTLADELYDAALKVAWFQPNANVQKANVLYHGESRQPKAWGPKACLEITSDLFWHDIAADSRARELGARLLYETRGLDIYEDDILVTTAMEALPVGLLVEWWNKEYSTNIQFAYSRGASNFDHPYLSSNGKPVVSGKTSIERGLANENYSYAYETAAAPILKMLELRSKESN